MFCLVLFMVFVIFRADAIHPETARQFIATGTHFRRGSAVEDVIQESSKKALVSRSGSGAEEAEINVIRLSYDYDTNENFTVWKDEPLKIIIENAKARYIWCFNKYVIPGGPVEYFVPQTEFGNNIDITLNITKVTSEMSTRWGCTILQNYHGPSTPYTYKNNNYTAKDLHFHLYVKGVPRQVILTANNQNVKYDVKTNLSVEYYGLANYTYEDGEDVEFSCKIAQDQTHLSDTVRLEYFNAEGIRLFQSKPGTNFYKFRSVLNFTNDKYYLDCICNSNRTGPVRETRYRTIFYMKKDAEEHAIKLSINGQRLASFLNDTSIDEYVFQYIDGEILNITCQEIHSFPKGTIYFSFDRNLNYKEDRREQEMGINTLKLLASNVNNKTISCGINNTEIQKPIAKLLLSSDIPDNGIRIRGLPRNNVLYQYTNDLDQWTIEYQYSVNDILSLTCVSKSVKLSPRHRQGLRNSPLFLWKFGGVTSDSPANWTQGLPAIKTSGKITKVLDKNHNMTKITCTYFPKGTSDINLNKTVEIIFRLKPKQSVFVREKNSEEVYTDKDSYVHMIVPVATSFGVAVAITTILCVICWHKRTKRLNLIENAYDNLSNENDSSIPAFPTQWESSYNDSHHTNMYEEVMQENYNYSTGEVDLNKMSFKRASNNSENHYTEIDDYFKPKPSGLTVNWNRPEPTIYNNASALVGTAHNSNDAIYNNSQGTYDKLIHNNISINKDNTNYSNLQSKGKFKSVSFRQMCNDWRPASKDGETSSREDCRNNDQRWKQNNDGVYANTDKDIYMQPGDVQKKPYNENIFLKNKGITNPSNFDYAEPYGDLGIRYNSDNKKKERKINFSK